jgi:hypothetical protein
MDDKLMAGELNSRQKHFWEKEVPPGFNFISLVVERYGPFAFGIVMLLIVWVGIAQPQIEALRIDFNKQQILVQELNDVANAFKLVGEQQKRTADVLHATSELLAKSTDEIVKLQKAKILGPPTD